MKTTVSSSASPRVWATLVTLLLLAGCSKAKSPAAPPVPVKVAIAERRPMPFELAATGTVEPLQAVAVQAQVGGTLQRVAFKEGDEVKQGQLLFQLDPRPYRAALDQALAMLAHDRAQADNAVQDQKRYESLVEKEYVTPQQYEQVRTTAAAAVVFTCSYCCGVTYCFSTSDTYRFSSCTALAAWARSRARIASA